MEFLIERADPSDYLIMADVIQSVWQQIEQKDWFVAMIQNTPAIP